MALQRRHIWFAARLALYALLALGSLALFQDHLLYFPDRPALADALTEARHGGMSPWPGEGDYRGLVREPVGPARATLVLFHGNAGHAGHRAWYAEALTRLGLRVILAEYPGYGPRPGRLGEESLVADAVATIALAGQRHAGPLLVGGESLGAGVAAAAVAQNSSGIVGLLLITPWDRLENVARFHYPWAPVGWLLRDRYDSGANLARYEGRVLVAVAERDSIVPARFGTALFAALKEPRRLVTIPAADHNDWPDRVDAAWWRDVVDFLLPGAAPPQ
jgi:alpha-beta hydrolase superfamily lysophospholipase